MALMFGRIEQGARWPKQVLLSRTVFFAKGDGEKQDFSPLSQRLLSITSHVYRAWGKIRLRAIRPWIERWQDTSLFGGFE
eukprot:1750365-Alexandrium_andersonii.AAC.1